MNIAKRPYEISLWEDVLTFVGKQKKDGKIVEMEGFIPSTFEGTIEGQYYKEVKLCIIGSDTMNSPARCVNPKLAQKINGENTLTFTMYYRYWDDETQNFVHNPYNRYMVNERKIKLRLGPEAITEDDANCQWFDFIIKNVQENSETKAFTYTCKDQFVNELSKSGFELVLDNELENNMGTVDVLAGRVLEGSDWQVDGAGSENLKQYKEEPLYKIKVNQDLTATALETGDELEVKTSEYIYVFYSIINDKKKKIQFLYPGEENEFVADDNLLIDKKLYLNYELDGEFEYDKGKDNEWPSFVAETGGILDANISTKYRGARLVKQAQTKYDSTIDKYVGVYKKDEVTYYGYTENEYISSGAIINYAANPSAFTSTTGWETDAHHLDYKLESAKNGELYTSYLGVDFTKFKPSGEQEPGQELPQIWVKNAGIAGNRSSIGSFKEGEKYVLRMKYKASLNGAYMTTAPTAKICEYHLNNDSKYVLTNEVDGEDTYEIFDFDSATLGENGFPKKTNDIAEDGTYTELSNYVYMVATCARSISERNLKDWDFKIGLFFNFNTTDTIYIEDVQIFPYETYNDGVERLCVPGGKLHSEVRTKYIYYKPNKEWKSIEDLEASYSGYTNDQTYLQEFNIESDIPGVSGFTKVRSISAKESNRFNLIQDLCETFECWAKLKVKRNQKTGQIKLDENFRQMKSISFHEYIGRDNHVGFRYGINSKSISRTLDSAAIVSKMIVKDNANEFAPNGFCSIARASENPTGENFLLNFDHYARQGLLDFDLITNDLYLDVNGYLGYYKKLKRLNAQRNEKIDIQSGLLVDISNYQSAYTTYKTSYDSAVENQLEHERDFNKLAGTNYDHDNFASNVENMGELSDDLNKYWIKWTQCQNVITQHKPLYEKAKINLDNATVQYEEIQQWLEDLAEQKRALNLQFYKKYSRFIQEGSWIKEDYTDPNLYYLDSESTLHTSAQPKVTYDIKVIDVAPLASQEGCEDFAHYDFKIGDKTYIEDVEFFGWSLQNRSQPYREEIVVSEITTELDAPEKNQIKVQNYKAQFEDLFQRITAQTQQAEYHTGEYQRAAAIVEKDGTLSVDTLENSFANNSFKLSNARDQSVVWDESGITTTSLTNPSEMVRIISGGVFLSTDGGASWKTGITGHGINTSYLTAGQINANEINILSGAFPSFRWDSMGLNAYGFEIGNDEKPHSFNTAKFVRFDQYGIYGINGKDKFVPKNETEVWDNAKYALTWSGFMLKNENGSVKITSTDDIQVLAGEQERIKIGRIGGNGDSEPWEYGIRISNASGKKVMETDDQGELWLRNRLRIGSDDNSTVEIGYLDETRENSNNVHEVIHAGDNDQKFVVYEDGKMYAEGAEFHGAIYATSGQIGNMTIGDVEATIQQAKKLDISSNLGYNFKVGANAVSPTQLELTITPVGFSTKQGTIVWKGTKDYVSWETLNSNNENCILTYDFFKNHQSNDTYYIMVAAESTDGIAYENWATIMAIYDGEDGKNGENGKDGEDALTLVIVSSNGNFFRNNTGSTVLTAKLFKGGQEIDVYAPYDYVYTWSDADDPSWAPETQGKTLTITADDVYFSRTYVCNISKGGN